MLWKAAAINGYAVAATDGKIGTIVDFLIDDTNWLIRWLAVDTGNWLSGRKVLLPSSAIAQIDAANEECSIKLTMQQIKDSPDIDTDRPVSRQMEITSYGYYGYSPYWGGGYGYWGGSGYPGIYGYMGGMGGAMPNVARAERQKDLVDDQCDPDDVHLRSVAAVTGYYIHASDGEIGHVEDFLIEDADWSVRYLVIDTKNWWFGKSVLIAPNSVKTIDWGSQLVNVDMVRQKIKDAPEYDSSTTVDQAYEEKFEAHYGIKRGDR